jgi:polysaccharide chain length determinant protein (PEP-CTERM system associated)
MDTIDITKYLDMALRRKYWIIIPFLLTLLAGLGYSLRLPKIYEAKTLILVQAQKVPQEYVRAIVSTSVQDRLRTITQQVTSRTNLEKIMGEYPPYGKLGSTMSIDDKVDLLRKRIKIDVNKGRRGQEPSAFTISFRDSDPKRAMQITNALASNFISENLKIRESHALGTSIFLSDEVESIKKRLMDKEADLKKYRERYMGGLPEQLQTNLTILGNLQSQADQYNDNLRDAENRKIIIQQQIALAKKAFSISTSPLPGQSDDVRNLFSLRNQLSSLEARYTQKHPDVIRLKKMIAGLEKEQPDLSDLDSMPNEAAKFSGVNQTLRRQFLDIELTLINLKTDLKGTKSQIKWYQAKVEDTPKREQELLSLNRDYGNLQGLYNSLLNRKLEAEIAVSMEKKQKGEQFRVIDPAKVPSKPVEPDVRKLLLMTLALGLGLGAGLAYLVEMMDTSFKTPEELEQEIQLPVLVSMPFRYTVKELRNQKRKKVLAATSVAVGFVISAVSIVLAVKGVDNTMSFVKDLFDKI